MLADRYVFMIERIIRLPQLVVQWFLPNLRAFGANRQPLVWILGIVVGVGAAILAILFREGIGMVQFIWSGEHSEIYLSTVRALPWYAVWSAPVIGGLVVGAILHFFLKSRRAGAVADVIEARHANGRPLNLKDGLISAVVTVISLGSGGSAGREGPVIHLGASFSSFVFGRFALPDAANRALLAAGAASAISASFNAPIAAVLFAHEVILGHYAMRAFVPIVLASVTGTVLSRLYFGENLIFIIPEYEIVSYLEFPAFFALGIVCALVAISFQFSLFLADYFSKDFTLPIWIRPAIGGGIVGGIGVFYPEIMGIGYETTNDALWGRLPLMLMISLVVLKIFATSVTLASRFGGGVFSPALYLGALTGGSFGIVATSLFPAMGSDPAVYAILGMGALAASVIGAPISTTVIVFELTGGYALSIALLFTIAVTHGINQALHGRSYFQWQLEMRGLHVRDGPYRAMISNTIVQEFMTELDGSEKDTHISHLSDDVAPDMLTANDSVETALQKFDQTGVMHLPVVDSKVGGNLIGWANYTAAMDLINKRLIDTHKEEHE